MQSSSSKLLESTATTGLSYRAQTSKSGTLWRENCDERGTLRRENCDERGTLWRQKELGQIHHIVAGKLPLLTKRGTQRNTSNWLLSKIEIMDCKWNQVPLKKKITYTTQTSHTIASLRRVNQLTSHFLKPGNSCSKTISPQIQN